MEGGAGNDTYVVDNIGDVIIETVSAGTDFVQSSVSYTLSANVENLTLTGSEAVNAAGNELNNTLTGNAGDNVLEGGAGIDTLNGGNGNDQLNGGGNAGGSYYTNDTLNGGLGNDTYLFGRGSGFETILEAQTDVVENIDTVRFGAGVKASDIILSQDTVVTNGVVTQANLMLRINGTTDYLIVKNFFATQDSKWKVEAFVFDDGTVWTPSTIMATFTAGTQGNDTLNGFGWDESIDGADGNDHIYGNAGNDTLEGGAGSDSLYGDNSSSSVAGNDTLHGGAGSDYMAGGKGDDTYLYQLGDGIDTIYDVLGNDKVVFGAGILPANLTLFQDLGNLIIVLDDNMQTRLTINGISTANNKIEQFVFDDGTIWDAAMIQSQTIAGTPNAMVGTAGNDTFIVDSAGDTLTEGANQGTDTVQTSVSYLLPANVENMTATGYLNLTLTGNALNNTIVGNVGNNVISDNGGVDHLLGGQGDDYYIISAGSTVTELANEGVDTVSVSGSYQTYTLQDNVENLIANSSSAYSVSVTGNALDNNISGPGNGGAYIDQLGHFIGNTIDGGAGADTMTLAGGGTFYVDNVGDRIYSSGPINVFSSVDFALPEFAGGVYPSASILTLTGLNATHGIGNGGSNTLDGYSGPRI